MKVRLSNQFAKQVSVPGEKLMLYMDSDLRRFGLYVTPAGIASYFVAYRLNGKRRQMTIGKAADFSASAARKEADRLLTMVNNRIDPMDQGAAADDVVSEFWKRYRAHASHSWRPRTIENNDLWYRKHIGPAIGKLSLRSIRRGDIVKLHDNLKPTPATGNNVLRLTRAMMNKAVEWELVTANPCARIKLHPVRKRERFLRGSEYKRLLLTIDEHEQLGGVASRTRSGKAEKGVRGGKGLKEDKPRGIDPFCAGLFRLLIFTGARLCEIMHAEWSWVSWETEELHVPDRASKTGYKRIQLPPPAIDELRRLHTMRSQGRWIIEGHVHGRPLANPEKPWQRIRKAAGLPEVRLHDLRHSHASVGIANGLTLPLIGGILGHTQASTTERYAHLDTDPVKAASALIAQKIIEMRTQEEAEVIPVSEASAEK